MGRPAKAWAANSVRKVLHTSAKRHLRGGVTGGHIEERLRRSGGLLTT